MKSFFIKTVLRNISHNKVPAFISIVGLAIGIGCGLVFYKIISYETGFDNYHSNSANIYRIINEFKEPAKGIVYYGAQVHPLGEALRSDFPDVDAVMTFYPAKGQIDVENKNGISNKYLEETGLVYTEPNIFNIFDFQFLAGNAEDAICNPGSVVLSSSLAQKYYNLSSQKLSKALGRFITINGKTTFQVTGIISDPPKNSDLPFKIIANYKDQITSNEYYNNGTDWYEYSSFTNCYVLLPQKISPSAFQKQLQSFFLKYNDKESALKQKYIVQPLSELHSGNCSNYNKRLVSNKKIKVLGLIGLFLIVIASINFINLSVAQAIKRFKEIGIKKMAGVSKTQLIFQFLGETVFISYLSAFAGLFIAQFLFIQLENIIGYRLNLDLLKNPETLIFITSVALIVGLICGLYPAFIMAGVKPIRALKKTQAINDSTGSFSVRRILVVLQFAISLILIIGTLGMQKQMSFFLTQDLGFNKDAILTASLPNANANKLQVLKTNLLKTPGIESVSFATGSPLASWNVNNAINYSTLEKDTYYGNLKNVDEDYLKLFKLKLIAGENYSSVKNTGNAVVNRKITKLLGFEDPHEALDEKFTYANGLEFTIVGVVEDFHAHSLHRGMDHVIFSNLSWNIKEMAVKISPQIANFPNYKTTVEKIQKEWHEIFPEDLFNYEFFDQQIAALYKEEKNTSSLVLLFAIISIIVGSLGLFGLISYVTNQKIKEIGIRKVNGAKISEIVKMLTVNFIVWIAIAFVIASPIAYLIMNKWLESFAYRTTLSWWIFALAGIISLGIALLTVGYKTFRAARRNPVEALRYE